MNGIPNLKWVRLIGLRRAPPSDWRAYAHVEECVLRDVSHLGWLSFVAQLPRLKPLMITGMRIGPELFKLADARGLRCLVIEGRSGKQV